MTQFRKIAVLAIFLGAITLAGCRVEFEAESVVRPDGSVERFCAYKAQEPSDKDEILSRYELPPGGAWKDYPLPVFKFIRKEAVNESLSSYEVRRVYAFREMPATDFKRFSSTRNHFASNQFRVNTRDWWFVKWYDYEETFRDIIKLELVKRFIDQILDKGVSTFRDELAKRVQDTALIEGLSDAARQKYAVLLNRYYVLVSEKGWDIDEVDLLNKELEKEFTAESVSKILTEKLPQFDNLSNRAAIAEAFHATEPAMSAYLDNQEGLEADRDEIFGIHGLPIFQSYNFKIRVRMPGRVTDTNASGRTGDLLEWSFPGTKLNQRIWVRSRKIFPWRLLLLVAVLAAMLVFFILRPYRAFRRRRKARRKPESGQNG